MEHGIVTVDGSVDPRCVEQVRFDERAPSGRHRIGKELAPPERQVVVGSYLRAVGDQPIDERAADEPGASSHKDARRVHVPRTAFITLHRWLDCGHAWPRYNTVPSSDCENSRDSCPTRSHGSRLRSLPSAMAAHPIKRTT